MPCCRGEREGGEGVVQGDVVCFHSDVGGVEADGARGNEVHSFGATTLDVLLSPQTTRLSRRSAVPANHVTLARSVTPMSGTSFDGRIAEQTLEMCQR